MRKVLIHENFESAKGRLVKLGIYSQWGGHYWHHTGTGWSLQRAAFSAFGSIHPSFRPELRQDILVAVMALSDRASSESWVAPHGHRVTISIPREIGPRVYKSGKINPGLPEIIDPANILTMVDTEKEQFAMEYVVARALEVEHAPSH